ncbi:ACT domain-containing protein [Biformimicrobium ophioploci]|uniref:ACT domain-containing protein n=1 Tax=Biformimicrobium ophioploci TaxID=3036711 RepID=A0ABQ6M006_9GAMM|nr:ACT domain-containing protein [Microbulbifer sp. NKW57]GMG87684.1 ACT domain-containing protein [Microbulbifer sp. NKW57]
MSGETDLKALLAGLQPELDLAIYVFLTVDGEYGDHAGLQPLAAFREREGMTLIVPEDKAMARIEPGTPRFRRLTLTVHSSLEAVGLTAAVAGKLADHGISANVVAAYYHDHIFVGAADADRALQLLGDSWGAGPQ